MKAKKIAKMASDLRRTIMASDPSELRAIVRRHGGEFGVYGLADRELRMLQQAIMDLYVIAEKETK